jgi:tetratricopeptide (TPR) repeat protein
MDALSELGIVGVGLLLGMLVYPLVVGVRRWRSASGERQAAIAALMASAVAVEAGFAIDWIWKLPAAGALWFAAVALLVGSPTDDDHERDRPDTPRRRTPVRYASGAAVLALAWGAIGAELIPLLSQNKIEASQRAIRDGRYGQAVAAAKSAQAIEPWAIAPQIQLAFAQARVGDWNGALASADQAREREPRDWRNYVILARLYEQVGNHEAALNTLAHGREHSRSSTLLSPSVLTR